MHNYDFKFKEFLNQYHLVGAYSAIIDKNNHLTEGCFGHANIEDNIKVDFDTIFRVASISKVIVALGIMKLYEQRLLNLDEDISTYLGFPIRNPNYPNHPITIKHLMTQTSSLHDTGDGIKGYYGTSVGNEEVLLKNLLIDDGNPYYDPKVFSHHQPGTTFDYCNFGCGILVCIIEKITGQYFEEYIEQILLKPLKINSGFKIENIKDIDKLATHYRINSEGMLYPYRDKLTFKTNQSKLYSLGNNFSGFAGGLYISGHDLCKILSMMMNKGTYEKIKLFAPSTIELMNQTHWQGISYDEAYKEKGLQQVILTFEDKRLIGHFGNAYGLRAFMLHDDNYGYIFIANGGDYLTDGDHLTQLLKDVLHFMIEQTGGKNE